MIQMQTEWNLKEIFENEEKLEEAIVELRQVMQKIKESKGKLSQGVEEVLTCYQQLEKGLALHVKIYAYAMLQYHQDMSHQESIQLYKRAESLTAEFSEAESFISPELSQIEDSKLEEYLKDDRMKEYEKSIRDIMKQKKHILSQEVEEILAAYSEVFSSSENAYEIFTNTEFDFPNIQDDEGNTLKMSSGLYSKYLMNPSERVRKQAFDSMYSLYKKHMNTITELYLARVKANTISAKQRNYHSSLEAATTHDDANEKVYDILLKEVNKNLYLNHEYIALKAKLLHKEKIHIYDVYTNPLVVEDTPIAYEDAQKVVLEALAPMGKAYIDMLQYAFDHNWIDVYEKDNKRSGAYSMGVYGVHPFVLLNYVHSSRDISTIAHELGHAMHSYYASKAQNIINENYTIMVAEVASTVNEILLANYQIKKESNKKKKAALINEQLDMIRATFIRQTMFAEFEKEVHSRIENGESLTADKLNAIYLALNQQYFGEATIIDTDIQYEWARIPHFYSCFYVYKYATGITSAIVIAKNILEGKEGYVDKYINMLSQGGSKDSLTLLKMVDVDLEAPETYEEAFSYFKKNLKELEELISELF